MKTIQTVPSKLKYELSSYKQDRFLSTVSPMVANNSSLADAVLHIIQEYRVKSDLAYDVHYVMEGGALPASVAVATREKLP